ncbi:MAG TPA: FAD-dependent monooxygenase [Casimicrobiaceae bacterium]
MTDVDVLIAGAGPTGLVLALWLARSGVRIRVVDKAATAGTTSRALVVHARTLEFYRQLGIADDVVEASTRFAAVNLWVHGRHAARVDIGAIGQGLTAYPYMLVFPQDEHERLLLAHLADAGVDVERPCALRDFDDRGTHVVAQLLHADGREETCTAAFLAGCDGAHSTVREQLRAGFPGATYAHVFYVADVEAGGPVMNHELHVALDFADLLAVFPMKGEGRARLIGTVIDDSERTLGKPNGAEKRLFDNKRRKVVSGPVVSAPLEWSDVHRGIIERLRMDVSQVNWFSTYHVHHRVASRFRAGRAFLLGDAAHIHSPVGGQGMNTGIGDAVNLGWKLAGVLGRRLSEPALDTYETERIAFARRLVATTDRAFQLASSDGPIARFVRIRALPSVMPWLFTYRFVRRFLFRTVSQTAIDYRDSALARGAARSVRAGDRLPWIELDGTPADNYASLASRDWQVHVYGEADRHVVELCAQRRLALHAFAWAPSMQRAGFARDARYLLRPDGYVALAQPRGEELRALARYLDDWTIAART